MGEQMRPVILSVNYKRKSKSIGKRRRKRKKKREKERMRGEGGNHLRYFRGKKAWRGVASFFVKLRREQTTGGQSRDGSMFAARLGPFELPRIWRLSYINNILILYYIVPRTLFEYREKYIRLQTRGECAFFSLPYAVTFLTRNSADRVLCVN